MRRKPCEIYIRDALLTLCADGDRAGRHSMPKSCEAPSVAARIGVGLLPHSSSKSCTMAAGLWGSASPGDPCSLGALGSAACSASAFSSWLHSFPELDKFSFRLLVTATWLLVLGVDSASFSEAGLLALWVDSSSLS